MVEHPHKVCCSQNAYGKNTYGHSKIVKSPAFYCQSFESQNTDDVRQWQITIGPIKFCFDIANFKSHNQK